MSRTGTYQRCCPCCHLHLSGEEAKQGRSDLPIVAPEPGHDLGADLHLGVLVVIADGFKGEGEQFPVGERWWLVVYCAGLLLALGGWLRIAMRRRFGLEVRTTDVDGPGVP